jgi:hypothetical protein
MEDIIHLLQNKLPYRGGQLPLLLLFPALSVSFYCNANRLSAVCQDAECYYAECRYADVEASPYWVRFERK